MTESIFDTIFCLFINCIKIYFTYDSNQVSQNKWLLNFAAELFEMGIPNELLITLPGNPSAISAMAGTCRAVGVR